MARSDCPGPLVVYVPVEAPTLTPRGWAALRELLIEVANKRSSNWRDGVIGEDGTDEMSRRSGQPCVGRLPARQDGGVPDRPFVIESMSDVELDQYACEQFNSGPERWSEQWVADMSLPVRAYVATAQFEYTVGNGGLVQLFQNWNDEPWLLEATIEGYRYFGLDELADAITAEILPVASSPSEMQLRERLLGLHTDPRLAEGSALNAYDHLIDDHTSLRVQLVRSDPAAFGLTPAGTKLLGRTEARPLRSGTDVRSRCPE